MNTLGKRIKLARESIGLTQEEVAEAVGVSRTAVSRWEHGEIEPKLMNLIALAEKLKVSADYLLGVEDHMQLNKLKLTKRAELALEDFVFEIRNEPGK